VPPSRVAAMSSGAPWRGGTVQTPRFAGVIARTLSGDCVELLEGAPIQADVGDSQVFFQVAH
jgi:hypothetical protein